ncbi:sensor histidine kinase [Jannaschia sp. R86511]|uniref:sensor histidine kinase n=1 Tax=Jannaschia sp. R86511 TaxID=3093853 RepID=UPI0036D30F89
MVGRLLRALWREPRVPSPARDGWWRLDVAVVAVGTATAVVEVLARDDVPWPPFTLALTLVCVGAALWRSRFPLAMVVLAYGAQTVAGLGPALAGLPHGVPNTTAVVLLMPYSLGRWASGRHVAVGVAFLMVAHFGREPLYGSSAQDNLIGAGFLLLPVVLGVAVRLAVADRRRAQEQVRDRERERLARDLHNTVAHHVSGIVLQAQGGRAVAATDPARAADVLRVIEEAATLSLAEMRSVVGVLRDGDTDGRAPVRGVADLSGLAGLPQHSEAGRAGRPAVHVDVTGEARDLPGAVDAAVYRVVQESVTNARWHARGATRVDVSVRATEDAVQVLVKDDGAGTTSARGTGSGLGIVGMRERVELLGGRLEAGPSPDGGWAVHATLPRSRRR